MNTRISFSSWEKMFGKWREKIFSPAGTGRSNLIEVSGALLLPASFLLPWFYGSYRFSNKSVAGAEMLLGTINGTMTPPVFTVIVLVYLLLLPLYTLIKKEAGTIWIFSLSGIPLLAGMVFLHPVRPWHYGAGVVFALAGLIMMTTGLYRARANR